MIRMRTNNEEYCSCNSCKTTKENALQMFDIQIGKVVVTLCDECNEKLLGKTLIATNKVNERLKTSSDMKIINKRRRRDKEL